MFEICCYFEKIDGFAIKKSKFPRNDISPDPDI
jgi:hypothetical protein